jgi:hypothetical protein
MPGKSRSLPSGALCAALATLAAGCGGGGSHPAGLVAQADPICKQVATRRTAANAALSATKDASSKRRLALLARLAPEIEAIEQQAVEKLRALKPSSAQSSDWKRLLAGIEQLTSDTGKLASAAKAGNENEVKKVDTSGRTLREELTAIAARDGFQYCGRES